ncbi:MAG: undecaprenyl-diphosphate phosphatase [Oscillospiraceae bacterium]|nr:undecaprenyl-diphosphate phosphatase [Oscillospiraceae bacterium]
MTVLDGFLQGMIQGLTEFLPVSSSGHLSLFQHFFGLQGENALFFSVMLHVGTLVAVFAAYWKTILLMIKEFFTMIGDLFSKKFSYAKASEERKMVLMVLVTLIPLLIVFVIKDYITALAEDGDILVEGVCFLITGSLLLIADRTVKGNRTAVDMTLKDALFIGSFQCLATLPGVSRSGSTISGGLMRGFSREFMVKFSFIMGIPAILGSAVFEFKDAFEEGVSFELPLLVGMITAAVFGLAAIKLIEWLVKTDRFAVFAYYALVLGVVVLAVGIIEHISGEGIVSLISSLFNEGLS